MELIGGYPFHGPIYQSIGSTSGYEVYISKFDTTGTVLDRVEFTLNNVPYSFNMMYSSTKGVLLAAVGYVNFAEIYLLTVDSLALKSKAFGIGVSSYKSVANFMVERSGYIYAF